MRLLLLPFLLLFISVQVSAQSSLRAFSNLPRSGDCLVKQQVKYKSPGMKGVGVLWDFSEQDIVNDEYKLKYIARTMSLDTIIGIEHRTMYYYQSTADSLLLLGYENPTTLINYRKPETLLCFPFSYGRSFTDYFDGMGDYCNKQAIHVQGKSTVIADAIGMMILPGGDTLNNVLRIHTFKKMVETTIPCLTDKTVNVDSIPFFLNRDSVDLYLSKDSDHLEINTWRWYADGYRYPVFETIESMVCRGGQFYERFSTSFYYPPHEQYYCLDDDPENQIRRDLTDEERKNRLWETVKEGKKEKNTYKDDYVAYSFYMDETGNLHLNYSLVKDATVMITLYDFQGRQLLKLDAGSLCEGNYQKQISLNTYPMGEYLLQIIVDEKIYGSKILNF